MEIPLNAQVICTDGLCGHSVYVLVDPVKDKVTHLVVKEAGTSTEYIVPVELISDTVADTIQLRCSKAELEKMDLFIKTKIIEEKIPEMDYDYGENMYGMGPFYYFPYVTPELNIDVPVEVQQTPPGELAVYRGTRVEATDGYIGRVDEFVVNPENSQITHLVLREGHLWGKKDVIIPLSAMSEADGETVHLKLDKRQIEALPTFPVHRRWS